MTAGIVIITGDGLEHRYVANRICAAFDVQAILVTDPPQPRSWKTILKADPVLFLNKALRKVFLKLIGDSRSRARELQRVLGAENCARFNEAQKVLSVGRPKAGGLRRKVEELAPDFIVVYGTGIVPDSVLSKARKKAFNMHTGISPDYRGTDCAFWPIHEGQPEMVGATVHECVSAVDGGEIYATGQAQLFRDDRLHGVFAQAVKTGADLYVKVLGEAVEGRLAGRKQDLSQGREFLGSMQGLRAELVTRWRLRRLRRGWAGEA